MLSISVDLTNSLPLSVYKSIHKALVPERGSFDLMKESETLISYIRTLWNISESFYENKESFWTSKDCEEMLNRRLELLSKLATLVSDIEQQIPRLESCKVFKQNIERERLKKQSERKEKKIS